MNNCSTNMETSCSQMSCCHVGVNTELGEIKQELRGLKTMVDFAVRLLTKLVPASTDDFRNILNGSTGLTITPVPVVGTSEADRLEIEVIQEPMEVEEEEYEDDEEEETTEQKNLNDENELSDRDPAVSDHEDTETSVSTPSNRLSKATSPRSSNVSQTGTATPPLLHKDASNDSSPEIASAKPDFIGANSASMGDVSVESPESESINIFTSVKSTSGSIETSYIPKDSSYIVKESNIPCTIESMLSSSISISLEKPRVVESDRIRCDTNNELCVNVYSPEKRDECTNPEFDIVHETNLKQVSPSIEEEAETSNFEVYVNLETVKVKEEVSSELCVLMKKEDEDNINAPIDGCEVTNPYQIYSELSPGRSVDHVAEGQVDEVSKLQPSPLKPLFGSALVSKLKQKIQEKIQAAGVAVNEDPIINENDNSLDARRCINVSLTFDNNCDSKQIMVSESKLRPKFYQCKICAKVFFCTIALHAHKNNCTGVRKQYRCNSCPLIFKSRAVLCNHRRLHAKKKSKNRHKCDICGREFILKSTLKKHRESEICLGTRMKCYKKLPQYFCSECGEGFLNSTNLALHQKLHEVDKKVMTNVAAGHIKKQEVPIPNRTVRRYPCNYCDESFIDKRSVTLHEKLHTDKEFAAFDQQRKMIQRRHQLMMMLQKQKEESAKKKYGCSVCGRCYPIELLLDMHTRLHHAIS
ncbi:hypothetical protein C0J52_10166 [Blattella germanica]|nr:hypothetical protein C0J52_10166 [Blattella germanica]